SSVGSVFCCRLQDRDVDLQTWQVSDTQRVSDTEMPPTRFFKRPGMPHVQKKPGPTTGPGFYKAAAGLVEGLDAGLGAAQDEGVHVVGAFVGVDDFQVDQVAGDAEFVGD